jgi:hypothetical protein
MQHYAEDPPVRAMEDDLKLLGRGKGGYEFPE